MEGDVGRPARLDPAEAADGSNRDTVVNRTIDLGKQIKACPECGQHFGVDAAFCPFDGSRLMLSNYEPPLDPLVGTVIDGRYEVRGILGAGGMGTVYEVRHKALGRAFAMKVLRRDVASETDLAARFMHEAKATAALRHPHIVSITDFGQLADNTPFFVMELLVGKTLAHLVKAGPIDAERARSILAQVASALGAAHEAGIIHRDLKPENVFLTRPTGPRATDAEEDVKIVDFGAAKILGASRITKTGIVFGTPHYMSPEQASGGHVDHRADVYAFGVIMYEMLTGRVPFEADTYMGVLTQHIFVQPKPPSSVRPDLADKLGPLEEITLRALEKKPEDRYQTMGGLAADLESASRGETITKPRRPSSVSVSRPSFRPSSAVTFGSGPIRAVAGLGQSPLRAPILLGLLAGGAIVALVAVWRGWRATDVPASASTHSATSVTARGSAAAAAPASATVAPTPNPTPTPTTTPTGNPAATGTPAATGNPTGGGPAVANAPTAPAAPQAIRAAPAHPSTPAGKSSGASRRSAPGGELPDPWAK